MLSGDDRARTSSHPTEVDEVSEYSHYIPRTPIEEPPKPKPAAPPPLMMSVRSRSGNSMTTWNLCDRRAVIRAAKGHGSARADVPCFDRRGQPTQEPERIHPTLVRYMEAYMLSCSKQAAVKAGFPEPVKLFLNISGAYVNRNIRGTSRKSRHAEGRALDIYDMSLIDANGRRTWIDTHLKGNRNPENRAFFNAFKRCWDSKLRCDEVSGSIGHIHSPGVSNHDHNDHLHIQAGPSCRGPR